MANEKDKERWCAETEQALKNQGKSQRIIEFSYYYGSDVFHTNESQSISAYSDNLKKAIDIIYKCTGSKITIVAHSMGGLVAREYLNKYSDSQEVNKLIMLGTPNKGIGFLSDFVCGLLHAGPECGEMLSSGPFIKNLKRSNGVEYITIAGDLNGNDGVVDVSSVLLDYAKQYKVRCQHNELYSIKCPDAYQHLKEALEDDYSHAIKSPTGTNLNQESINIQPSVNSVQQYPITATHSNIQPSIQNSQKQQEVNIVASSSQFKPEIQKPIETQPEPQKQEQKREEPKTIASAIKSWFSRWFG